MPTSTPRTPRRSLTAPLAALLSLAFALLCAPPSLAQDLTVGVVDFGVAIEQTEGERAIANLEREVNTRKQELKTLEEEILAMEEELKQNASMLSDEAKRQALMGYQKKAYEYQQLALRYEQEITQMRDQVIGRIQGQLQQIAVAIAQENNVDLMLERNEGGVIYFSNAFDFTEELIRRYKADNP